MKADKKKAIEKITAEYWAAVEKHPGPAFSREEFCRFLGGAITPGRLANLDSEGLGPDGSFYQGRKKMYLKAPAVEWALRRVEVK